MRTRGLAFFTFLCTLSCLYQSLFAITAPLDSQQMKGRLFKAPQLKPYRYAHNLEFIGCSFQNLNAGTFFHSSASDIYLYASDFKYLKLEDSIYKQLYLSDVRVLHSHLTRVSFVDSGLRGVSFRNSKLEKLNFIQSQLENVSFTGKGSTIKHVFLFDSEIDEATRDNLSKISSVYYELSDIEYAARGKKKVEGPYFYHMDIHDLNFSELRLSDARFISVRAKELMLRMATFRHTTVMLNNWANIKAFRFKWLNSKVSYSTIENSDFSESIIKNSKFKNVHFKNVNFRASLWQNVVLENCSFENCEFAQSKKSNVRTIHTKGFKLPVLSNEERAKKIKTEELR